jgi:hypothetical protein
VTLNEQILLALQHGVDVRGRNAGFQLSHFAATPGG